jgi:Protein of unknown function (DUF4240)
MTLDEFWSIVDRVHAAARFDIPNKCRLLADELRKLPPEEIRSWKKHYDLRRIRANHWDIHAIGCLQMGCISDDGFLDFKNDIVSCGRHIFESVIRDPDSLGDLLPGPVDLGIEGYQYIAGEIYGELTGGRMEVEWEPHEIQGREWFTRDDLQHRFPRMWKKYGDRLLID